MPKRYSPKPPKISIPKRPAMPVIPKGPERPMPPFEPISPQPSKPIPLKPEIGIGELEEMMKEVEDRRRSLDRINQMAIEDLREHRHQGIDTPRIHTKDLKVDNTTRIRATLESGTQSIGETYEIVEFGTETFDEDNSFDISAYRFTALTEATYFVSVNAFWTATVVDADYYIAIYKNGAAYSYIRTRTFDPARYFTNNIIDTIQLDVGDYIEIYAKQDSGSAQSLNTGATYLSIFKI